MLTPLLLALLTVPLPLLAPAPAPAKATAPAPANRKLTPAEARAVVDEVAGQISKVYVLPDRRATIVDALRAAQKRGRYDVDNPTELAARLTDDLEAAGKDKHLYVRWSPTEYRAAKAPPGGGEDGAAFFAELGRRRNQGVEDLRILEGNVRYLRYSLFLWEPDVSGRAIEDAIRFLKGGDAVIVDLRGNGGGSPGAVQYLVSHFIDEPGRLLVTFRDELTKETRESRVLDFLPAGRVSGKPVLVLIDGGTGSAAEEFAAHVKHFKFGALVGRTTAGAAHNNSILPIAPGFVFSVSTGRPVHGVSKGDWEGVGIAPDIASSGREALDVALLRALDDLSKKTSDPRRKAGYAWARTNVSARLTPPTVAADALARHAGRYGDRTVRVDRGALLYARPGRDEIALIPLGGDLFALGPAGDRRVRFVAANGRTTALELVFEDGQTQRFDRAGDR